MKRDGEKEEEEEWIVSKIKSPVRRTGHERPKVPKSWMIVVSRSYENGHKVDGMGFML